MSAANSLDQTSAPGVEQRAYEPSMEEILASIRRIIADDQSLPGRDAQPASVTASTPAAPEPLGLRGPVEVAPAPEPITPEPLARHPLQPDPALRPAPVPPALNPEPEIAPAAMAPEAPRPGPAHGMMSAPQYAMPDGPVPFLKPEAPEPELPEPEMRAAYHAEPMRPEPTVIPTLILRKAPHEEKDEHEFYSEPLGQVHESPEAPRDIALASDALFSTATDASVAAAFKTLAASRIADNSDELLDLAREMIRPLLKTWIDNNLPTMVERLVRAEIERVARGGH